MIKWKQNNRKEKERKSEKIDKNDAKWCRIQ
jgi:hypothetical protein